MCIAKESEMIGTEKNRFNTHEKWLQHDGEHKYRHHLAQRCTSQEPFLALWTMSVHNCCIDSGLCCWNEIVRLSWRCRCRCSTTKIPTLSQICFHFELIECNTWQTAPKKKKKQIKTNKQTERRFTKGKKHAFCFFMWTETFRLEFTYRNNSRKLSQEKRTHYTLFIFAFFLCLERERKRES